MRRLFARLLPLLCAVLAVMAGCSERGTLPAAQQGSRAIHAPSHGLPGEARATLALILRGGPFPYSRDGTVFQNRERLLPLRERGYYREYTVPTPGARDRGARRIVAGGDPPEVFYYTPDHYRSFQRISPPP